MKIWGILAGFGIGVVSGMLIENKKKLVDPAKEKIGNAVTALKEKVAGSEEEDPEDPKPEETKQDAPGEAEKKEE